MVPLRPHFGATRLYAETIVWRKQPLLQHDTHRVDTPILSQSLSAATIAVAFAIRTERFNCLAVGTVNLDDPLVFEDHVIELAGHSARTLSFSTRFL